MEEYYYYSKDKWEQVRNLKRGDVVTYKKSCSDNIETGVFDGFEQCASKRAKVSFAFCMTDLCPGKIKVQGKGSTCLGHSHCGQQGHCRFISVEKEDFIKEEEMSI